MKFCVFLKDAYLSFIFIYLFLPYHEGCGILVPWPEIEPMTPAVEVQSLNHWTTKEVP